MKSRNSLIRAVGTMSAVAILFATGCAGAGGGNGNDNSNGNDNGNGNQNSNDNTNTNNNDNSTDDTIVALIATSQNFNVVTFDDAALLNGADLTPSAVLEPSNASGVLRPQDSVVSATGVLFICSESNDTIAIYDSFLTAAGSRPSDRNVTGTDTMIDSPISVAIDRDNDVLYVANREENNILVYSNVSDPAFDGEVAPSRTFSRDQGSMTPDQIFFDGGSLYVVADEEILVFEDDGTLNGPVAVDRFITNPAFSQTTRLNVSVDSIGRFVLTSRSGDVFIYNNASALDGSPTPDVTITVDGASTLNSAWIDSDDRLYAMDFSDRAIYVIDEVSQLATGTFLPDRTIMATGFEGSDRLYVHERPR